MLKTEGDYKNPLRSNELHHDEKPAYHIRATSTKNEDFSVIKFFGNFKDEFTYILFNHVHNVVF